MTTFVVIGLGLIGGSIAKACKEYQLFERIIGIDNCTQSGDFALHHKIVDEFSFDLTICKQADVIILATPVLSLSKIFAELANLELKNGVIISDVGSVKQMVIEQAQVLGINYVNFVPAHPIAGSEQSGISASKSDLFINHQVILTPSKQTNEQACAQITDLWRNLGAKVTVMNAIKHDQILAATSHLPHLLAFALVDSLAKNASNLEIFNYAAGGFRDFTRIAGSDPQMWHDIFVANKEAILASLESFSADLVQLKQALAKQDSTFILDSLRNAQGARSHFAQILATRNKS